MEEKINFNYLCYEFTENLKNTINGSGLPLMIVYYILKDVFQQVSDLKDQELLNYMQEEHKNEREETIEIPVERIDKEKEEE